MGVVSSPTYPPTPTPAPTEYLGHGEFLTTSKACAGLSHSRAIECHWQKAPNIPKTSAWNAPATTHHTMVALT
ncbi:hypothetical protein BO71DRAFT_396270 [Aspergillus ellipticus CBS 707.79]|uniref:Uncharacterized protein n=1 Tax=Aspergillus ellipticus CBS 707.79 TaxID=1448320 RepID=A0A319E981_9EURO|nr:hypothetical protein BO71DRAFT_396270 [Aspergillus ellipticus CBS 707.79]